MADNSIQTGGDTIRDKDRAGVKTQVVGRDLNIGGASEVLELAAALADATATPTVPGYAAFGFGFNGTTWDRLRSISGALSVQGVVQTRGVPIAASTGGIAAGATGTLGPWDVSAAGNATFFVKNMVAASPWAGTPVLVFEQSDDNVSWAPLPVMRTDTSTVGSTFTLAANTANSEIAFNTALLGTSYVRVRVTTGPTTNGLTIVMAAGTLPFEPAIAVMTPARVLWSIATAIAGVTAVTTEALITMVPQRDGTAAATATSQTVTAGKRLRITSMAVGLISTAAAVISGRISLRLSATGAATATSPIVHTLAIPSGAALAQAGGWMYVDIPDGIELSGPMQLGVTQVCSVATGTLWVSLVGYEY